MLSLRVALLTFRVFVIVNVRAISVGESTCGYIGEVNVPVNAMLLIDLFVVGLIIVALLIPQCIGRIQCRFRFDFRCGQFPSVQSNIRDPAAKKILSPKTDPERFIDAQVVILCFHNGRFAHQHSIDVKLQRILAADCCNVMPSGTERAVVRGVPTGFDR